MSPKLFKQAKQKLKAAERELIFGVPNDSAVSLAEEPGPSVGLWGFPTSTQEDQVETTSAITPTTNGAQPATPVRPRGKRSRRNPRPVIYFDGSDQADAWMVPGHWQSKPWLLSRELQEQRLSPAIWAELEDQRDRRGSAGFKSIEQMLLTFRAGIHHKGVNYNGAGEQGLLMSIGRRQLLERGWRLFSKSSTLDSDEMDEYDDAMIASQGQGRAPYEVRRYFDEEEDNKDEARALINLAVYCAYVRGESESCIEMIEKLIATDDQELVYATPYDRVLGIGHGRQGARGVRNQWGMNLLGKALMELRDARHEHGNSRLQAVLDEKRQVEKKRAKPARPASKGSLDDQKW